MEQQQNGRALAKNQARSQDGEDLGRSFAEQGSPSYGGDLGVSFVEHNSSPDLWVDTRRKSHVWIWVVAFLAILLTAFLIYRLTRSPSQTAGGAGSAGAAPAGGAAGAGRGGRGAQGPAVVTTGESHLGSMNIYNDALGTVTPVNTVTLYSQITGRVMAVYYKEGQMVRKGQPLVEIDPRPYQATLDQAKGTLQHDQSVLAQAQVDLERYRAAYARNAIAKQQLDDQEQVVIQYEGTVQTDQATVAYDLVQLSYTHIVSPITGRVGLRLVDPGNTVFSGTGSTLAVITQIDPITVVFTVSEDDLPQIQAQGKRALEVDAYDRSDDKLLEKGVLIATDNQIDTTTGTVKFRARFANKGGMLFPNQFVNARLLVRTLNNAVLVPEAAVQHNGTASFVYVVSQSSGKEPAKPAPTTPNKSNPPARSGPRTTVRVQPINVVFSNERESAVEGIGGGVTLATSGFDRLENNAEVKLAPAPRGQGQNGAQPGSSSPGQTSKSQTQGSASDQTGAAPATQTSK